MAETKEVTWGSSNTSKSIPKNDFMFLDPPDFIEPDMIFVNSPELSGQEKRRKRREQERNSK